MTYKPVWIFHCRECGGVHRSVMEVFGDFPFPFPGMHLTCPVKQTECHTAEDDWKNLTEEEYAAMQNRSE